MRGLYAQLCQMGTLRLAHDEVVAHPELHGAVGADFEHVPAKSLKGFLSTLSKDLRGRRYQPSATVEAFSPLRDLVVQAAFKIVLGPVFEPALSSDQQSEKAAWVARAIEHGLTRVYVEHLEPCAQGGPDEVLLETVKARVADAEFVAFLEMMLKSCPALCGRGFLAPVLACIAFQGIDAILEEAKAIGRHESLVHVACARFGRELIVLVHAASQYDWVLPAIRSRLVPAWDKFKVAIDPKRTQVVDMGKGGPLRFLGFEFRSHKGETPHVDYHRLQTADEVPWSAKIAQGILAPLKYAARALGTLVPDLGRRKRQAGSALLPILSPLQDARKAFGTALASDWRALPLLFLYAARYGIKMVGRNWELAGLALCGAGALLLFWGAFAEVAWEKPVPDDPGFFTGAYYWSSDSKPVPYGLYIPAQFAYEEDGRPLIVFLDDFVDPNRTLQDGLASAIRVRLKSGGEFRFAVFFPGHPRDRWATPEKAQGIMEALDHVMKRHRIDPKRLYLVGYSGGGLAVLDLAASYPERWAALVSVSPTWMPYSIAQARIPCWLFECSSEKRPNHMNIQAVTKALIASPVEVHCSEYSKAGRDYWREVYGNPKLFTWLAQKTK